MTFASSHLSVLLIKKCSDDEIHFGNFFCGFNIFPLLSLWWQKFRTFLVRRNYQRKLRHTMLTNMHGKWYVLVTNFCNDFVTMTILRWCDWMLCDLKGVALKGASKEAKRLLLMKSVQWLTSNSIWGWSYIYSLRVQQLLIRGNKHALLNCALKSAILCPSPWPFSWDWAYRWQQLLAVELGYPVPKFPLEYFK